MVSFHACSLFIITISYPPTLFSRLRSRHWLSYCRVVPLPCSYFVRVSSFYLPLRCGVFCAFFPEQNIIALVLLSAIASACVLLCKHLIKYCFCDRIQMPHSLNLQYCLASTHLLPLLHDSFMHPVFFHESPHTSLY